MRCNHCGYEMEKDYSFCPTCGAMHWVPQENVPASSVPPAQVPPYSPQGYNGSNAVQPGYPQQPYGNIPGQQYGYGGQPPMYGYPSYSPFSPTAYNARGVPQAVDLIGKVSRRVQNIAIAWLVIGVLQAIVALIYFILAASVTWEWKVDASFFVTVGITIGIMAAVNISGAIRNFKFSKMIRYEPVGIVQKYEKVGGYIAVLVINLLFGAIFGIIAVIMELILRNFILENAYQLRMIEEDYQKTRMQPGRGYQG